MAHNQQIPTPIPRVELRKGDVLNFIVACREHDNSDSYEWSPIITVIAAGDDELPYPVGHVWHAANDFRATPTSFVDGWTLAAQALLVSNEFFFVD